MIKKYKIAITINLLALYSASVSAREPTRIEQAQIDKFKLILKHQHPQFGDVAIPSADAVLHLGKDYYFLDATETKEVLVEGWGNPKGAAEGVLGMVFPSGKRFVDDTWGAVVTYQQTGYVADDDAKSADYSKVLDDVRSNEDSVNEERKKEGVALIHLVGWASPPTYDPKAHSIIWARDIKFTGQDIDSLNYDVRLLGRRGVLSLNMVSLVSKLPEIKIAAQKFGQAALFNTGARYADFNSDTDKKADYGLAGLVAAGVGVAVAKKLGFLGVILLFGKKAFFVLAALFAGFFKKIKGLFGRAGSEEDAE